MNTRALDRNARLDPSRAAVGRRVPWTQSSWWPWARRFFTLAFFAMVVALIWRYARNVDCSAQSHGRSREW